MKRMKNNTDQQKHRQNNSGRSGFFCFCFFFKVGTGIGGIIRDSATVCVLRFSGLSGIYSENEAELVAL